MLARHPKTGAEIRIIKSEGSVWRDQKTLVWLDGTEPKAEWGRWDIGTSSIESWKKVTDQGFSVNMCILRGETESVKEWLFAGNFKKVQVIIVPKAILLAIGYDTLVDLKIENMLCLEEIIQMYPFIEVQWDETEDSAKTICAIIMRYSRSFPVQKNCHSGVAKNLGIQLNETLCQPPQLIFVTQYYKSDKRRRANEIDLCLKKNVECPYIDKIVLLNETTLKLPVKNENKKIEEIVIGKRLHFDIVFKWIYDSAPAGSIVVIANSDIYLDTTWRLLWSVNMADKFLSLLRWDDQEDPTEAPKLFGPRPDSQDSWVISADSVKEKGWDWKTLNFPFGKGGCDNAINVEMLKKRFLIVNPCMSLVTHHVHTSGYRTYDPQDIVEKPVYMYLTPTGIHDLKPELILPKPFSKLSVPASQPILRGPLSLNQKETFYTMLQRSLPISKDGTIVGPRTIPLCEFTNVIQGYDGLLNTFSSIYIGPSKVAAAAWGAKEMSILSPCVDIDVALVAYCPDEIATDPYKYMLNYLGKILVLQEVAKATGEFLGVNNDAMKDVLNMFKWPNSASGSIPVLARDPSFQAWCRKAYAWYPQDDSQVTPQEIAALRNALQFGWDDTAQTQVQKRIVCIIDSAWITEEFASSLDSSLDGYEVVVARESDTLLTLVEKFNGAWGLLTLADQSMNSLAWLLPRQGRILEVQVEIKPSVDLLHLSGVAELLHELTIVPRLKPQNGMEKKMFLQTILESIQGSKVFENTIVTSLQSVPQIIVPYSTTTGYFAHTGDSFREMVGIWADRGYVTVKEDAVHHVWLNGVGETLLYDRPTLQWLEASPPNEQRWKKGLFGNPPPIRSNSKPWSFWPRSPRLVEELSKGAVKGWSERTLGTVFYGRSENHVQKKNRTGHDWSSACDEFVHLDGTAEYPYTHREYLERLSNARWGLCLAGFGKKCHREIECMAMGCVPVVASEVDMTLYANPPEEGVHYIRVKNPDEMKRLENVSEGEWTIMSKACRAWWEKNSSAKGLWELTKAL